MDTANGVVTTAVTAGTGMTVAVAISLLLVLLVLLLLLAAYGGVGGKSSTDIAARLDGPTAYPIIGALHAMDGHRDKPFRRFTELASRYGPVYAMTMGSVPCVVVNDYPSIKEVLVTRGSKFGGRPDFVRYNALFAGDRNNCEYLAVFRVFNRGQPKFFNSIFFFFFWCSYTHEPIRRFM